MKINETLKALDNKVMSSKWTPRILAGVTAVSTAATSVIAASADDAVLTVPDTTAVATQLGNSAMQAVQSGYTAAIPVMTFGLMIGVIIRKIMGAARHS